MSVFYDNFIAACAAKKVSPSAAAEAIGLSRTSPNGWKKGKQPSEVNLKKLSDYFGVPVSYFDGGAEEKKEKIVTVDSDDLEDLDIEFIRTFRLLSEKEKRMFLAQMQVIVQMQGQ